MEFFLSLLSNLFTTALWEVGKAFLKNPFVNKKIPSKSTKVNFSCC